MGERIRVGRRRFVEGALGLSALGTLAACGGGSDEDKTGTGSNGGNPSSPSGGAHDSATRSSKAGGGRVQLPTYTAYQGAKPDLPGTSEGAMPAFLKEPTNLVKAVASPPGDGSEISTFVLTYGAIAPPLAQNRFWQGLNQKLGSTLKITVVPAGDYQSKFATLVAGGDMPDLLQISGQQPQLAQMLEAKFANLDKFLSGDAVKQYPLLANIPNVNWEGCVYNNAIYGLPVPRSKMGSVMLRRDDLISAKGVDPDPKSFADFKKLCQDLTDTKANVWALAAPNSTLAFVQEMLGVANGWAVKDGKFTSNVEQEGTKQALSAVVELVKAGVVHPDSFDSTKSTTFKLWFNGGQAMLIYDGFGAWGQFYSQNTAGPSFKVGGMLPPDYDGNSKANTWQWKPNFSFTAVKKADDKRIDTVLRVCNWLAAPVGTQEADYLKWGVKDVDYTEKNGTKTLTDAGVSEIAGLGVGYIVSKPQVLLPTYGAEVTKAQYEFQLSFLPISVPDPSVGLYSDTSVSKGNMLNKLVLDAQTDILASRKPVSSWDDAVKSWQKKGGDQMRKEFEDAYAQANR